MSKQLLVESVPRPTLAEDGSFRAVLITPGKGSSGHYSEEVLRRDASVAFPPGTISWINHPSEANPTRDPRDMFGTYPDGGHYEEGVGVVGKFVPLSHMREFAEAVAPHAALSIYAMGESDAHGNITALLPDVQNSVDLVGYPGRPGSGLTQMYEAAIAAASDERTANDADGKKEAKMTPEQEAKLNQLVAAVEALAAESKETADKRAKESADAQSVDDAVAEARKSTVAALKALHEADLPKSIRENLEAVVESGTSDIAPLIESAKATVEEITKGLKEDREKESRPGFILGESSKVDTEAVTGFKMLFEGSSK